VVEEQGVILGTAELGFEERGGREMTFLGQGEGRGKEEQQQDGEVAQGL